MSDRNLTDEDVAEIVKGLKAALVKDFYGDATVTGTTVSDHPRVFGGSI